MTYFKLDIPKVNESISRYKDIKNNCLEDLGIVYRGLGYTESAWNDFNAYTFIEKTKRDKYKINEYFDYLDSLYNEINQFKTDIDSICSKQGYRRNSITFKFDDSDIDTCKRYLDSAISYLNDSLNRINISAFRPEFEYIGLVYGLRNEIRAIRNSINELKQDINDLVNSVNNEIYDSKFRLKRISNFDFNLKPSEYRWKVTDLDTKTINKVNQEIYSDVKVATIKNNVQDSMLSKPVTSYNTNINEIDAKEIDTVKGLNNNLNNSFAGEKNIGLQETQTIQGLNNNLNSSFANQHDIVLEESKTVNGLNQNLNAVSTKEVSAKNENINDIEGLNNNLNLSSANKNTMTFDSIKDINNLDDNIVSAKANNNSINYNINNTVNVADNIVNAKVSQANIDASNIVSNNYDLSSGINIAEIKTTGITTDINKNVNIDTNIKKMESLNELDKK